MERILHKDLDQILMDNEYVILSLSTDWSGECKMVEESLNDLVDSKWKLIKIDVDENKLWVEDGNNEFKVKNTPKLVFYKNSEIIKENNGYIDKDSLLGLLDEI